MRSSLVVLALVGHALSGTTQSRGLDVKTENGIVVRHTKGGIDSFFGIPYVKPPVSDLRLRRPEHLDQHWGTRVLPESLLEVSACAAQNMSSVDTTGLSPASVGPIDFVTSNLTSLYGEDCLTINVQRPAGVKPGTKLPVLFWIYGGSFTLGTTQTYDGTGILKTSLDTKQPVIFVAANYRLNAFGFLHGKQLQQEGNTNLGLRDQCKALEWVAENIAALAGESAGAISVFDHLLINRGDHRYKGKPLFRGGIMNSGSIFRAVPSKSCKAQNIFDTVANAAGCSHTKDVLACLRHVPYQKLVTAMNAAPNYMGVHANDISYLPRPDPSDDFFPVSPEVGVAKGAFAHVPVIMGTQQDESALFSIMQRDIINSTETLVDYMHTWLPEASRELVADLINTYPDTPAAGVPANTGSQNELYPQFKRLAAIQSDLTFIMGRREALSRMASKVPTWSYLATYLHNKVPYFGTYHTSDIQTQFGLTTNLFAAKKMDAAYINFVNHLDPNDNGCDPWWPQWNEKHLLMANFSATEATLTKDDFRWEGYEFWKKHSTQLRQ